MTTIDTAHLRALAEASLSRGTWVEEDHSNAIIIQGSEGCAHDGRALAVAEYVYLAEDRAYIAAIDPPTLIALLDRLDAAREYIDNPGNWSALDGRRRLLLAILDGKDPR